MLFGVKTDKSIPADIAPEYLYSEKRIIVMHLEKGKILDQLRTLGITKGSIFPEIDRVAEYLRDVYGTAGNEELTSKFSGRKKMRR